MQRAVIWAADVMAWDRRLTSAQCRQLCFMMHYSWTASASWILKFFPIYWTRRRLIKLICNWAVWSIKRRAWSVDLVLQQYRLASPSYIYVRDHCSFRYTTYMAITTCWSSACLSVLLLVILMIAVMIPNRTDPFQPAPGKEWVRPAFPFNTSWSDRSIALAHLDSTHPRLACSTVMGIKIKTVFGAQSRSCPGLYFRDQFLLHNHSLPVQRNAACMLLIGI
jgi:hypothetical protein